MNDKLLEVGDVMQILGISRSGIGASKKNY